MKIVTIVGARPQFIKCAPVSQAIRKEHEEIIVHTGQHYDANMSDIFFTELAIPAPDYNLGIGSGPQGGQTGKMLAEIENVLQKEQPDMVLVYGDTNSTLAGSLAAVKLHIPVAHVEAGLRSYDRSMPEEINRIITDHVSNLLFCPTQTAVENLAAEGITKGVYLTGDVMVDALINNVEIAEQSSKILDDLGIYEGEYYVATVHRASNTDSEENLRNIMEAFGVISESNGMGDVCKTGNSFNSAIIFPAHPRTVKCLKEYGIYSDLPGNIRLTEPFSYLDMLHLMKHAKMILTDSGGVQKEAYILKVPCVTLRENTEWMETLENGWNVLVGADSKKIVDSVRDVPSERIKSFDRFGKGDAAEKICSVISSIND
ncbi:non-hydrolyzing UDP-N-acetylglucosamine 2-epimerase [Methanogenium organophilum]|uniref:UDP-N-acetylglucosamine 2-epimerase (Non-hydrolyzing) n=1 Tax=Methanogenium organophilum TaxID=2199 RepID=A0A9X9S3E5_METOG|nr:UDP-N-acetylglucosamine 2-epimerase (non-hydrolyzing) [Methanogenium organophilum]WAI01199.1 UDP-N-acetylglucosamine 2-epimerase (non-hydrolyzing) [Methanogenium organophilum]